MPGLKNLGGVREISRRLKGSDIIFESRDAIAAELLALASTKITDIIEWDAHQNVTIKDIEEIPDHALAAIKKIRVVPGRDGQNGIEVEMIDKVRVLQMVAKSAGIMDREAQSDKPSVIEVTMVGPEGEKDG